MLSVLVVIEIEPGSTTILSPCYATSGERNLTWTIWKVQVFSTAPGIPVAIQSKQCLKTAFKCNTQFLLKLWLLICQSQDKNPLKNSRPKFTFLPNGKGGGGEISLKKTFSVKNKAID